MMATFPESARETDVVKRIGDSGYPTEQVQIAAGEGILQAGDVLGLVTAPGPAQGQYRLVVSAATDGSATPAAILTQTADARVQAVSAVVVRRDAQLAAHGLRFGDGFDDVDRTAALADIAPSLIARLDGGRLPSLRWLAPLSDVTPPAAGESLAVALAPRIAGTAPLAYALTGGSAGVSVSGSTLTLDATALPAGAPLAGTVTVSDAFGQSAASAFALTVAGGEALPPLNDPLPLDLALGLSGHSYSEGVVDMMRGVLGALAGEDVGTRYNSIYLGRNLIQRWHDSPPVDRRSAREDIENDLIDHLILSHNMSESYSVIYSVYNNFNAFYHLILWRDLINGSLGTNDTPGRMFLYGLHHFAQNYTGRPVPNFLPWNETPLLLPDEEWEKAIDALQFQDDKNRAAVNYANTIGRNFLMPPTRYIPWPKMFQRLIRDWLDGVAPAAIDTPARYMMSGPFGETLREQHLSGPGRLAVAMLATAVMYRRDVRDLGSPTTWPGLPTSTLAQLTSRNADTAEFANYLGAIAWEIAERDPQADLRNWGLTPDFVAVAAPGALSVYKTPSLDPAALPAQFDVQLRVADDPVTANWTTAADETAVPVTFSGLAAVERRLDFQYRSPTTGDWSGPVTISRVVPETVQIVATVAFNRADSISGVSLDGNERYVITIPAAAQPGDLALWLMAGIGTLSAQTVGNDPGVLAQRMFPVFRQHQYVADGAEAATITLMAGAITADTPATVTIDEGMSSLLTTNVGTLVILRGASLEHITFGNVASGQSDEPDKYIFHDELPVPYAESVVVEMSHLGRLTPVTSTDELLASLRTDARTYHAIGRTDFPLPAQQRSFLGAPDGLRAMVGRRFALPPASLVPALPALDPRRVRLAGSTVSFPARASASAPLTFAMRFTVTDTADQQILNFGGTQQPIWMRLVGGRLRIACTVRNAADDANIVVLTSSTTGDVGPVALGEEYSVMIAFDPAQGLPGGNTIIARIEGAQSRVLSSTLGEAGMTLPTSGGLGITLGSQTPATVDVHGWAWLSDAVALDPTDNAVFNAFFDPDNAYYAARYMPAADPVLGGYRAFFCPRGDAAQWSRMALIAGTALVDAP